MHFARYKPVKERDKRQSSLESCVVPLKKNFYGKDLLYCDLNSILYGLKWAIASEKKTGFPLIRISVSMKLTSHYSD